VEPKFVFRTRWGAPGSGGPSNPEGPEQHEVAFPKSISKVAHCLDLFHHHAGVVVVSQLSAHADRSDRAVFF